MLIRSLMSRVVVALSVLGSSEIVSAAVPAAETLYPNSTKAYFSVANAPRLTANWEKTQLYQLFEDPVMKPFTEDLRKQLEDKWLASHQKIGLSVDDLRGIASGELSAALVGTSSGRTAMIVLVDVTGNEDQAQEALEKADKNLIKERARKSHKTVSGVAVTIYDLPAKEDSSETRHVAYLLKDGLLAGADGLDALTDLIARLGGQQDDSLTSVTPYQHVMKRLVGAAGELVPDVRWYIDPLAVAEFRAVDDEKRQKNVKMLRNEGFGASRASADS